MIEFKPDATIITANENFLSTMGYTLDEVRGRPHAMFLRPEDVSSPDYKVFWEELRQGKFQRSEFRGVGKGGREVWI